MRVLITGAGQPLSSTVELALQTEFDLRLTTTDLRDPDVVANQLFGIEAVLHLANFDPPHADDNETLDRASRGTYVLLQEAAKAGVQRVVYASTMTLFDGYPREFVVDENWQPLPRAAAESLAPYLGELVCREFAREGRLKIVCLRLGDDPDANVNAIREALADEFKPHEYSWRLRHAGAEDRGH
jgi:nucleoside-diphosphate-sugar epimerase